MPVSMPGTEEQGATTAASLFGVSKEAVSDDDPCLLSCDLLFVVYFCYLE
jgi:hypothetical protein